MGAIEDTRRVLQDFLAPELRAISARLDALDKNVGDNERRAELRHSETMSAIRQVLDFNSIQQRLTKLESREVAHQ
jgi:hypothetical protein